MKDARGTIITLALALTAALTMGLAPALADTQTEHLAAVSIWDVAASSPAIPGSAFLRLHVQTRQVDTKPAETLAWIAWDNDQGDTIQSVMLTLGPHDLVVDAALGRAVVHFPNGSQLTFLATGDFVRQGIQTDQRENGRIDRGNGTWLTREARVVGTLDGATLNLTTTMLSQIQIQRGTDMTFSAPVPGIFTPTVPTARR
jgi:hypothetical protein